MSATLTIARNEIRRLVVQPWPWALAAASLALLAYAFLLSLDGFLAISDKLGARADAPGVTDLIAIPLLRQLANLMLLLAPLLSMRAIAGERRAHTLPLLLAAGVGNGAIVFGKWLATTGYLLVLIALTASMPLALALGTDLDGGKFAGALLALALEAGALVAIGLLASSWVAQPVLAATLALAINLLLGMLDAGARLQGIDNEAINYFALPTHLDPLFRGVVASVDIVYFALVVVLGLSFAARRLDALRSAH
jgi:ABC-2 type transport system permease protein